MRYENLEVWKRSYSLCVDIYRAVADLRDFGFRDQLTRSALSVPSNIAEGFERVSDREKQRFVTIAKGSSGELKTQLMIGRDIGYLPAEQCRCWIEEAESISQMLGGLLRKLS